MILIDTASIYHSLKAVGKRLDYNSFIKYLLETHGKQRTVVLYVDAEAEGFLKYLSTLEGINIITKPKIRKKISKKQRIWYLSFAVDMSLMMGENTSYVLVTTDVECVPICDQRTCTLYGLGIPKALRDVSEKVFDIPEQYLNNEGPSNES